MSPWVFLALIVLAWWCFASSSSKARSTGGRCGACGFYVSDTAAHEAGHVAVAEKLGYKVSGAVVWPGEGGFTSIPGWSKDPWHTMVMAAAGAVGENRERIFFKADINGFKSWKWSDAWWCHQLAPQVAEQRGITATEAIRSAQAEAERLLSANLRRWRQARDVLEREHHFGDVD